MPVIQERELRVKKLLLPHTDVLAGLDLGCSLSKAAVVRPTDDVNFIKIHFAVFSNKDIEELLNWTKQKLSCAAEGRVKVTGVGGDMHLRKIENSLGLKTEFTEEFQCQVAGCHFLYSHFDTEQICYPPISVEETKMEDVPDWAKALLESQKKFYADNSGRKFPVLLAILGSTFGVSKLNEDGIVEPYEACVLSLMGGRTFLGLAKILLGTGDYDEVMALAEKGDNTQVDTVVRDVIHEGGQYSFIPPDTPMFAFGRVADKNLNPETLRKEDLAAALVGLFVNQALTLTSANTKTIKSDKIYVAGSFFRSPVARRILMQKKRTGFLSGVKSLTYEFINIEATGALGALLSTDEPP